MKTTNALAITRIALGVGALIVGGAVIYFLSRFVPFPGMKYVMMSPYLSVVMYVLMKKIPNHWTPLLVCLIFGGIMGFIHLFMGVAIFLTGLLTWATSLLGASQEWRSRIGSVAFSTYTLLTALGISKYILGGVFESVPFWWIVVASMLGSVCGAVGVFFGRTLFQYIANATAGSR